MKKYFRQPKTGKPRPNLKEPKTWIIGSIIIILILIFSSIIIDFVWDARISGFVGYSTETITIKGTTDKPVNLGDVTTTIEGQSGITVRDVLSLVIIPIVLALGIWWLNREQRRSEQKIAQGQEEDKALQHYIDAMKELLIDKKLLQTNEGAPRNVARPLTIATLHRLDGKRNGILLRFLIEAGVIESYGAGGVNADQAVINFRQANLIGINLSGADVRKINLSKADLRGADLKEAHLDETNLKGTQLDEADLSKASLRSVDLSNAKLNGAKLNGAYLEKANLRFTRFKGADLRRANLSDAHLESADLSGADLRGSSLYYAALNKANLTGANLTRANLAEANLTGANLKNANLKQAHMNQANLSEANLNGADLRGASLIEAYLRETKINDDTQLDNKWRRVRDIVTEGAEGLDLSRADLHGANLRGTNLRKANLREANLTFAYLLEANLSGADLRGAKLEHAVLKKAIYDDKTTWSQGFDPKQKGAIYRDSEQEPNNEN